MGKKQARPFDVTGFIMDYEGGDCSDARIIEGFQHLIDTGLAWTLQGSYGRMAAALIKGGHCRRAAAVVTITEQDEQGRYEVTVPNIEVATESFMSDELRFPG